MAFNSSSNPFHLLDNDAEDLSQLVVAKPVKALKAVPVKLVQLPTKPAHPSQVVKEAKNGPGNNGASSNGGRGGYSHGRGDGGNSYGRGDGGNSYGRGDGDNRVSRGNDGPANENGHGGGYRRSEEGEGGNRRGSVSGYNGGGRGRGGFSNGEAGDFERPRRNYERHSGTGHGNEFKRDGAGRGNWGTTEDEIPQVTEESTVEAFEKKEGGEVEATDATKETPVVKKVVKEPEVKTMSLEEYEKVLEEKRKALQTPKVEERKVDTKAFEAMQQLSSKKSNSDDVFIKLGTEKDKRFSERVEKTKKSLSINEFLKPADGKSYPRGGYRGGRGGRGPRDGARDDGPRDGPTRDGAVGREKRISAAPAIEDTAQFPTLGK